MIDPNKLAEKEQQCLHIGGQVSFLLYTSLLEQSSSVVPKVLRYEFWRDGEPHPPYPPDTKGFLYYSMSPGRPRIAGEVRLRVIIMSLPTKVDRTSCEQMVCHGRVHFT